MRSGGGYLPRPSLANCARIAASSLRRAGVVSGNFKSSARNASSKIFDTMRRALRLSSAGTTNHGARRVLVAVRHFP